MLVLMVSLRGLLFAAMRGKRAQNWFSISCLQSADGDVSLCHIDWKTPIGAAGIKRQSIQTKNNRSADIGVCSLRLLLIKLSRRSIH